MESNTPSWQERFGLTTCAASAIKQTIPPTALGVAVVYAAVAEGEQIYLVVESRAGALLEQCTRRLQTAKLPSVEALQVAFKAQALADSSAESVHAACREQVIFAGEMRRELRPAMR